MPTKESKFKKCPNGHYYDSSLSSCPYCPSSASPSSPSSGTQTIGVAGGLNSNGGTSTLNTANSGSNGTKTIDLSSGSYNPGETTPLGGGNTAQPNNDLSGGRTMVIGTEIFDENGQGQPRIRTSRKLVGWLVSYTIDDMGVDYKLYEGKNIIGRDIDCNISVPDPTVSGQHAVILFRSGKYSIKDNQSTSGTFVNKTDIDLDAVRLNDGDIIKMGETIFKFRSSF